MPLLFASNKVRVSRAGAHMVMLKPVLPSPHMAARLGPAAHKTWVVKWSGRRQLSKSALCNV